MAMSMITDSGMEYVLPVKYNSDPKVMELRYQRIDKANNNGTVVLPELTVAREMTVAGLEAWAGLYNNWCNLVVKYEKLVTAGLEDLPADIATTPSTPEGIDFRLEMEGVGDADLELDIEWRLTPESVNILPHDACEITLEGCLYLRDALLRLVAQIKRSGG